MSARARVPIEPMAIENLCAISPRMIYECGSTLTFCVRTISCAEDEALPLTNRLQIDFCARYERRDGIRRRSEHRACL